MAATKLALIIVFLINFYYEYNIQSDTMWI